MTQVRLERTRIVSRIGQRITASVPEHVSMHFNSKFGGTPSSLDHSREARRSAAHHAPTQRRTLLALLASHDDACAMPEAPDQSAT